MACRNIVIKNNTRCFKSALLQSSDFSFLFLYILADLISFLEIQRLQPAGSSSTVFAVNLILNFFLAVNRQGKDNVQSSSGAKRGQGSACLLKQLLKQCQFPCNCGSCYVKEWKEGRGEGGKSLSFVDLTHLSTQYLHPQVLSNRKHGLFHIRYLNKPLELGYPKTDLNLFPRE